MSPQLPLRAALFILFLFSPFAYSQTDQLTITVDRKDPSYENKVGVNNPTNTLLYSICDPNECFLLAGNSQIHAASTALPDTNNILEVSEGLGIPTLDFFENSHEAPASSGAAESLCAVTRFPDLSELPSLIF